MTLFGEIDEFILVSIIEVLVLVKFVGNEVELGNDGNEE